MDAHLKPLVTVAVVSKEDEARIEACLRGALAQDYPELEVIVADAMSMDATRETVLRVGNEDGRVRLVDNPDRTRAAGLNAVLRVARGEIIVPMDPGGDYARTHVSKCVEALAASPADHLAIVPRAAGRTLVERALSAVQQTTLAFTAPIRTRDAAPTLLGAVRRRVFSRVGLFDPKTKVEEEAELSARIAEHGGELTVRRDIVVHQTAGASFRELAKRHYQLGRGRARRTVKDRRVTSVRTLAPLAIVAASGALVATSSVQPVTPFALAAYALVTGAAAVRVGRREGLVTIPIAWAAYPVMHVAHGVGFGAGLVRAVARPDWEPPPRLDDAEPA